MLIFTYQLLPLQIKHGLLLIAPYLLSLWHHNPDFAVAPYVNEQEQSLSGVDFPIMGNWVRQCLFALDRVTPTFLGANSHNLTVPPCTTLTLLFDGPTFVTLFMPHYSWSLVLLALVTYEGELEREAWMAHSAGNCQKLQQSFRAVKMWSL